MAEGNDLALGYMMGNSDGGSRNNGGMFGGDNSWIFAFLIIAIIFGDRLGLGNGNNGNNGGGNNGCNGGVSAMPMFIPYNAGGAGGGLGGGSLCSEFSFNNLQNGVRSLANGLCDSTFALQNGINGLGTATMQGFHGVDNAVCNLGYQTQAGFNALGSQLAQCCCETQRQVERGFCDTNYNLATNTTAIIQNSHNDTDRVIAKLDAMEMARKDETIAQLRSQVQSLNLAASQANQNNAIGAMIDASQAEILRRTGHDCPSAAYIVQPPTPVNFPTNCCGTFNGWGGSYGGCNNGCGNNGCC